LIVLLMHLLLQMLFVEQQVEQYVMLQKIALEIPLFVLLIGCNLLHLLVVLQLDLVMLPKTVMESTNFVDWTKFYQMGLFARLQSLLETCVTLLILAMEYQKHVLQRRFQMGQFADLLQMVVMLPKLALIKVHAQQMRSLQWARCVQKWVEVVVLVQAVTSVFKFWVGLNMVKIFSNLCFVGFFH